MRTFVSKKKIESPRHDASKIQKDEEEAAWIMSSNDKKKQIFER